MNEKVQRVISLVVVVLLFAIVIVLDLYVLPGHLAVESLFAIPILVSAQNQRPKLVVMVAVVAMGLYIFSVWWKAVPVTIWPYGLISGIGIAYLGIVLSIRLEEEDRRVQETEQARTQLQQFMSVVAHELRGPLTTILGYSQLLSRKPESISRETSAKAVSAIEGEARRMDRLTADLLDASRIGSGHLKLEPEPMDLVRLAVQVADEQQGTTNRHHLVVEAPPALEGTWDAGRIHQALSNLVSNAIKYSPEGGEVRVRITREDDEAQVSVTDQGVGLAPEDMPLLFEPFSRAYRQQQVKGTGLGLYVTRGIIDAHGGRIWAESPGPGMGATFAFTLPLKTQAGGKRGSLPLGL